MSLDYEDIHIELGAGLDTKSDERSMKAPKLSVLQNAVFDEPGGFQKRTGFNAKVLTKNDGSGNVARLRGLGTRDDELVLFAEGRAWSWTAKDSEWMDRGRFESVLVDQEQVFADRSNQIRPDRAELSNIVLYAWNDDEAGKIKWRCVDKVTGAIYKGATATEVAGAGGVQCRAVNDKLHVYYWAGANTIKVVVIDPTDVYGTIDSAGLAVSSVANVATGFDVCKMGNNFSLLMVQNTSATKKYNLYKINNAGSVSASRLDVRQCDFPVLGVSYNATADRISTVRWQTGNVLKHDWLVGSTLADDGVVDSTITTGFTLANGLVTTVVLPISGGGYKASVFYDMDGTPTGDDRMVKVHRASIASGGATTEKVFCRHSMLGSRAVAWSDGGTTRSLVHVLHDHAASIQPTYFLMDGDFVVGDINGTRSAGEEVGLLARLLPAEAGRISSRVPPLPQIEDIGSSKFASILVNRRRVQRDIVSYAEEGIVDFVYETDSPNAYRGVQEGKALYLPGGYVAQYDGVRVIESGFLLAPDVQDANAAAAWKVCVPQAGTGAMTSAKAYSYKAFEERYNAAGELQESTYLGAYSVDLDVAHNEVVVILPTNGHTNDDNILFAVYRTEADPGLDAPYYRTTSYDPLDDSFVKNLPNADTVTFTDRRSDASLRVQAQAYNNPGELGTALDHVAPPATKFIVSGQSRVFTVDPRDPHTIRYSFQRQDGDGVAFNDTDLLMVIPRQGGIITGIDVTDDGLLVFKREAIYFVAGQGQNALGQNPYGAPQRVVSAIGAVDERSIVRVGGGVLFKSDKGIYLLGNDFEVSYIGAPVDTHNGLTISGAIDIPDKHRVVFLGTSTGALVYDYYVNEWALWTGLSGRGLVYWNGNPVLVNNNGTAMQEGHSGYQDASVGVSKAWETGWIKVNGLQGYSKARWFELLGEWRSTHNLRMRVAYNYDDATWADDTTWSPPTSMETAGKPLQVRKRFKAKRRIESFKLRVEDVKRGATELNESLKITGLSVNVGFRKGLHRLNAAQTA